MPIEIPGPKGGAKSIVSIGEPVEAWRSEIESLQKVVHLWELVQQDDVDALQHFFQVEKPELPPKHSAQVTVGKFSNPALYIIKNSIRAHLRGQVPLDVTADDDVESPALELPAQSLRAGLWLMLALEIHDHKRYRACVQCDKWFEILTGTRRTTRMYCSDACRIRTYRGRQDQAKRLHEEGVSLGDIARELETDVKTVKRWVGNGSAKQ